MKEPSGIESAGADDTENLVASETAGKPPRRLRVGLRLSLVLFAIFTMGLRAAAVHVPLNIASRANVTEMSDQVSAQIVSGVSREIEDIFASAVSAQSVIERLLADEVIDVDDHAKRENMFLSFLLSNKHFSWVIYGKPNGDFYGARRRDDINYRLVRTVWDPATKSSKRREQYLVDDGVNIRRTIIKHKTDEYDATKRPWFVSAVSSPGKDAFTNVYVFASSGKPGINVASVQRKDGKIVGVVSIAIALERISKYLGTIPSVRSGAAFVVDKQGRLLAFTDPREVTRLNSDNRLELIPLAESRNSFLKIANAALAGADQAILNTSPNFSQVDPETGKRYFVRISALKDQDWYIGAVLPEADFTAVIEQNYFNQALSISMALLLIALVAGVVSRQLFVRPLRRITDQTNHISQFDLSAARYMPSRIREIDSLALSVDQMSGGLDSFRKYLPAALVRTLLDQGMVAEPSGQRRTLTILFMDLEGFTATSERLGHRIVPLLSEYLDTMSGIIHEHGGTIDKYIGDAVMAFWGAPQHNDEHALDACQAALACVEAMAKLSADWESRGKPSMQLRIGINTGRVVVGNIGSNDRLNYTVIGDPVNLASRLEEVNKTFGTKLIVGQNTRELVRYDVVTRKLDEVHVRGREEPVGIYEVLGVQGEDEASSREAWITEFEEGLKCFRADNICEAGICFRRVIELRGDDAPSLHYLALCEEADNTNTDKTSSGVVSLQNNHNKNGESP